MEKMIGGVDDSNYLKNDDDETFIEVFPCPKCRESFATRRNLSIHYYRWCKNAGVEFASHQDAIQGSIVNSFLFFFSFNIHLYDRWLRARGL